jgi:hypothetical protein
MRRSPSTRVLERMDAMISETDDDERPVAYNRVAGFVVTGNEDGAPHVISEVSGALGDIGLHDSRPGLDVLEQGTGTGGGLLRSRRGPRVVPRHRPGSRGEPAGDRPRAGGEPGPSAALGMRPTER